MSGNGLPSGKFTFRCYFESISSKKQHLLHQKKHSEAFIAIQWLVTFDLVKVWKVQNSEWHPSVLVRIYLREKLDEDEEK